MTVNLQDGNDRKRSSNEDLFLSFLLFAMNFLLPEMALCAFYARSMRTCIDMRIVDGWACL